MSDATLIPEEVIDVEAEEITEINSDDEFTITCKNAVPINSSVDEKDNKKIATVTYLCKDENDSLFIINRILPVNNELEEFNEFDEFDEFEEIEPITSHESNFDKEYKDAVAGNKVVSVYDEFELEAEYVEGAYWEVKNQVGNTKIGIDAIIADEATRATITLLNGQTGEFDIYYNDVLVKHIVVKSL